MRTNTNIPIFAILTIFVASNTLLYQYLNNGYFVDKKPKTAEKPVENVIFYLIEAHEAALNRKNEEILREAELLRNKKAETTDSEELKAIEDKLRALEAESQSVLQMVESSENERLAAEKRAENDKLQLTELMETNSRMGAELDKLNEEFDTYVETLKGTLEDNSFSEKELNEIKIAFRTRRGLEYLNDMIGNIQINKTAIQNSYTDLLNRRSEEYHNGLKAIAQSIEDNGYTGIIDESGLIIPSESALKLKTAIDLYLAAKDRAAERKMDIELAKQEARLLLDLQNQLTIIREEEEFKYKTALADQYLTMESEKNTLLEDARIDKEESLKELEERLRAELAGMEKTVEIYTPEPDELLYTRWIHIPGLWESTDDSLHFAGKRVDTIAWSRLPLEDNQIITFRGEFSKGGDLLINLYGNGKFKNWDDGIILSLIPSGGDKVEFSIFRNGLGDKSETIYSDSISLRNSINGDYYLIIVNSKLTLKINEKEIVSDFNILIEPKGKIGFINRENNSREFNISNIRLFNIR